MEIRPIVKIFGWQVGSLPCLLWLGAIINVARADPGSDQAPPLHQFPSDCEAAGVPCLHTDFALSLGVGVFATAGRFLYRVLK